MSPEQANDGAAPATPAAEPSAGVLAALPRTRPQRASARRAAARARAQSETAAPTSARARASAARDPEKQTKPAKRKPAKRASAKQAGATRKVAGSRAAPRASARTQAQERAPQQGYEPEEELELGHSVHPPSGGELIESLADIVGELASAGAGAGGRLLKDALSIFRRP